MSSAALMQTKFDAIRRRAGWSTRADPQYCSDGLAETP
jgi:hypothetical protein